MKGIEKWRRKDLRVYGIYIVLEKKGVPNKLGTEKMDVQHG
jgi:hypothetical protein